MAMINNVIDISGHHIDTIIGRQTASRQRALKIIRMKYPMSNKWWRIINEGHYGKAGMRLISNYRDNAEITLLSEILWTG